MFVVSCLHCRTVPAEDKSFAVGVQYMMFRVLGESPSFMPSLKYEIRV